jgi:hypothetical protein
MGVSVFAADNSIRAIVEQLMSGIEFWSEHARTCSPRMCGRSSADVADK